jgi:hypothetical protein
MFNRDVKYDVKIEVIVMELLSMLVMKNGLYST